MLICDTSWPSTSVSRPFAAPPFQAAARSDAPAAAVQYAWGPWLVLAGMTVLFAAVFAFLSVARHEAFQSHAFDLGNMDQAVWNTLHGHFLRFTDMHVHHRVLTTRLAIHVEPLLAVLALLYLIHSGPETLLVTQALVVAVGTVPAYLIARQAIGHGWLAIVFPLAYLLHPSLQNAVLDDFHAVTLSACFLLWALYFAYRAQFAPFAVAGVLAASTKEEVALMVGVLGTVLLYRRRYVAGAITMMAGLAWFFICLGIIIPANNPAGQSPYLGRYAYLGHGLGGVLAGAIRHPDLVLRTLFATARLNYLSDLLHPAGFLSVLAFPVFLLALPALLINMLSANPRMYSGFYQYSAEIVPYVIASAAIGTGLITRRATSSLGGRVHWVLPALCLLILSATAYDSWRYGFSPLSHDYAVPAPGAHQRIENRLLGVIPPGAVVAAADEIESHLSDRSWIYLLPTVHPRNGPVADYIALDASVPSLPVTPVTLHRTAMLSLRHGYGIVGAGDGILVLRRHAGSAHIPSAFYSFIFSGASNAIRQNLHWGPLRLVGIVVHPSDRQVNRSRPSIGVETFWRVTNRLSSRVHITVLLSPVYQTAHPVFPSGWRAEGDSPTWDWLPLRSWPAGRSIRAASLPLTPATGQQGWVDVAVEVEGLGAVSGTGPARLGRDHDAVRIATVGVNP